MKNIVGKKLLLGTESYVILPDNIKGILVFIDKKQFDDAKVNEFTFEKVEFKDGNKSIELILDNGVVVASKANFKDETKDYVVYIAADENVTKVSREDLLNFFATQVEESKKSDELSKNKEKKSEPQKNESTNPIVYGGVLVLVALFAWLLYLTSTKADNDIVNEQLAKKSDTVYVNEQLTKKVDKSTYDAKMKAIDGTLEEQAKVSKKQQEQIDANTKAMKKIKAQIASIKKSEKREISSLKQKYKLEIAQIVKNQNELIAEHCKPTFFFFNQEGCADYLAIKKVENDNLENKKSELERKIDAEIKAIKAKYAKQISKLEKNGVYQIKPVKI